MTSDAARCPACEAPLEPDATFCGLCGIAVDGPVLRPAPTLTQPLPPPAADGVGTEAGAAHPDPVSARGARRVPRAVAVGVVLAVVAGVTFFVVRLAEGERQAPDVTAAADGGSVEDAPSEEGNDFSDLTTPPSSRADYVDALVATSALAGAQATPVEIRVCFFGSVVDALGGPEGLRLQSVNPSDLAARDHLGGLDVPADAAATLLAGLAVCGVDLAELLLIGPSVPTSDPVLLACISLNLDRTLAGQSLARYLFDPAAIPQVVPPDLRPHLGEIRRACTPAG